ncbi:hypothetical protein COU76_03685 [Candidatus Peregrinibacteria bacterium CG10_big_fil_rev_8_21_14_0_10_49_10]|nr:MAG: hypothetical protein COU76_03685 [Candidatus Peregrinibacteria bacterium CG10_big_fil_rev_8_21_14_0_10_49_10]
MDNTEVTNPVGSPAEDHAASDQSVPSGAEATHTEVQSTKTITGNTLATIVDPLTGNMIMPSAVDISEDGSSAKGHMTVSDTMPRVKEHFGVFPGIMQLQLAMQAMLKEILQSEKIPEAIVFLFSIQEIRLQTMAQVGHTVETGVAFTHQNIRNGRGSAQAEVHVGVKKESLDGSQEPTKILMTLHTQPSEDSEKTYGANLATQSRSWPTTLKVEQETVIGAPEGCDIFPDVRQIEFAQQSAGILLAQRYPGSNALAYKITNVDFGLPVKAGDILEANVVLTDIQITNLKRGAGIGEFDVTIQKAGGAEHEKTSMHLCLRFMGKDTFKKMTKPLEEKRKKGRRPESTPHSQVEPAT